jgi:hypothetical protein
MKEVLFKVALVLSTLLAVSIALYYFTLPEPCEQFLCFQDHMSSCSPATFVNDEPEASWKYTILKRTTKACFVEVTLLQAKEGDLKLRQFEGHDMMCSFNLGIATYPDKDLSVCHGLLKEDLQGLIIEKLHTYLLDNLADIQQALGPLNQTLNQTIST